MSLSRTAPATAGADIPATTLRPDDPFPTALGELELVELQVLHSRVCRQLEHEYVADPCGPHPLTLDRCEELTAELELRQGHLDDPGGA